MPVTTLAGVGLQTGNWKKAFTLPTDVNCSPDNSLRHIQKLPHSNERGSFFFPIYTALPDDALYNTTIGEANKYETTSLLRQTLSTE